MAHFVSSFNPEPTATTPASRRRRWLRVKRVSPNRGTCVALYHRRGVAWCTVSTAQGGDATLGANRIGSVVGQASGEKRWRTRSLNLGTLTAYGSPAPLVAAVVPDFPVTYGSVARKSPRWPRPLAWEAMQSLSSFTFVRLACVRAYENAPMAIACSWIARPGAAPFTKLALVSVGRGRFGTRTYARRKIGRGLVRPVLGAEPESCIHSKRSNLSASSSGSDPSTAFSRRQKQLTRSTTWTLVLLSRESQHPSGRPSTDHRSPVIGYRSRKPAIAPESSWLSVSIVAIV